MPRSALTEETLSGLTLELSSFLVPPSQTALSLGNGLSLGEGLSRLPWKHVGPPHFPESEIELDALLPGERLFKNAGWGGVQGQYSCLIPGAGQKGPSLGPLMPCCPPLRWIKWSGLAGQEFRVQKTFGLIPQAVKPPLLSTTRLLWGG